MLSEESLYQGNEQIFMLLRSKDFPPLTAVKGIKPPFMEYYVKRLRGDGMEMKVYSSERKNNIEKSSFSTP